MADIGRKLVHASKSNDFKTLEWCIVNGVDINWKDLDGETALHKASAYNAEECCKILLTKNADVEAKDNSGETALHKAAAYNSIDCCKILLTNRNVDVEARDNSGATSLHTAAFNKSANCCKLLLRYHANVEARSNSGRTPLNFAAYMNSKACCNILLEDNADVDAKSKLGQTSLHFACMNYEASSSGGFESLDVIVLLIRYNADINSKDQDGKTPLDHLSSFKRRTVRREYEKYAVLHKLKHQQTRPMKVVKVFLCGDPAAGKTTIKCTLIKKLSMWSSISGALSGSKTGSSKKKEEAADDNDYERTPGIDVSWQSIPDAGHFLMWDCAGQGEYSVTHGMFLGAATVNSIYLVVYNLASPESKKATIRYWLPFIRATQDHGDRPQVVLVGTHLDQVHSQRHGNELGNNVLKTAHEKFQDTLDIENDVIVVDGRKGDCDGIIKLRAVLKRLRKEMIRSKTVPKLCDKVQSLIEPLRHSAAPFIGWNDYVDLVMMKYEGMDEDTLKLVTSYFHLSGEVYWAKLKDREDQLILNTQWFTSEIIGAAFAGDEFSRQFRPLRDQSCYTEKELREFFPGIDVSRLVALLDNMDLAHVTADGKYLLPGKLPLTTGSDLSWDKRQAYELMGRSVACVKDVDIFSPAVFPCMQKKILDEFSASCRLSRSAITCIVDGAEVFVMITKHRRVINVGVVCTSKYARGEAHAGLNYIVDLIQAELLDKSKGTNIEYGYISPLALRRCKDLEEVWSFSDEKLVEAEVGVSGLVVGDGTGELEDVTKILCPGYDQMFLREFGWECRYQWLPVDAAHRCFHRLDRNHRWGEDYTSVGKALGIPEYEVERLADDSRRRGESPTNDIIKKWCKEVSRKMTIRMLQRLLSRLSLVDNADALAAIDEVVERYASHIHQETQRNRGLEVTSDSFTPHSADHADYVSSDFGKPMCMKNSFKIVRWRIKNIK